MCHHPAPAGGRKLRNAGNGGERGWPGGIHHAFQEVCPQRRAPPCAGPGLVGLRPADRHRGGARGDRRRERRARSAAPGASRSTSQRVAYQGYTFTIPRTWRVIRLAAHPHACVRFDRHVLYLGAPGRSQDCPSTLIGTTEALLVQPATARATAAAAMYPVDRLITVTTRRVAVTATYSTDRALVSRILASASLRVPVHAARTAAPPPGVPGNTPARIARPARCCRPARPTSPARASMRAPRPAPPRCRPGCGTPRTGRWASTSGARTGPARSPT